MKTFFDFIEGIAGLALLGAAGYEAAMYCKSFDPEHIIAGALCVLAAKALS